MTKILHITTHFGGGVGRVLLNYIELAQKKSQYIHSIASLDYINESAIKKLSELNVNFTNNAAKDYEALIASISLYDIIVIHWWNHPLMYEFLVKYTLPKCRVIMWGHISGLYSPSNFTKPLFDYADKFIFTTPISYESDIVKKLSDEQKKKISVIWSTAGVDHVKDVKPKKHSGFNVGYLGTVDYSKLHRNFLDMSAKVSVKDIHFTVCGGENEEEIGQEAISKGIDHKFTFTGKVDNISKYLEQFDLFGYPLAKYHFGTCDQVLSEAMACGLVPVVFNNPMERSIVQDGITGIVVSSELEYIQAIEILYKDNNLRRKLAKNAKEYALKSFSLENMFLEWEALFGRMIDVVPSIKKWSGKYQGSSLSGFNIFLESAGEDLQLFINTSKKALGNPIGNNNEMWFSKTKGSPFHYHSFFPHDKKLLNLCEDWINK